MIDPFTIVTVLSSYATGQKIGGLLSDWSYGKNIQHLQNGVEHFSNGVEKHDSDFLEKAIFELDHINENDDRLFVLAYSYFYRALCYTYLFKFSLAYHYLDKLESIDYDFFTRKKDTIEETKRDGQSFRNDVVKLEKAYNEYLKSLNSQQDDDNHPRSINLWKIAFVGLSCVIIVGLLVVLLYKFLW